MLSIQIDARQRLIRQKCIQALVYPAFVTFLSIAVAALLTILILPTLVGRRSRRTWSGRKHIDLPLADEAADGAPVTSS